MNKFAKAGQWIVVELDDEVDYLLNDSAIRAIQNGDKFILVMRVIDRKPEMIEVSKIERGLKSGKIDYIDAR